MTDQAIDWGFAPRHPREGVDALVDLWRRARLVAENQPPCPCHGIVAGQIDPDVMEQNMLSPLRTRYRESGQTEFVALIDKRLRKSPFAGMRQPFEKWLHELPAAALAAPARKILYADLAAALQVYADARPEFTCM